MDGGSREHEGGDRPGRGTREPAERRLTLDPDALREDSNRSSLRLTSPSVLKELLTRHDYAVSSALGQNFLCDASAVRAIVVAAEPDDRDVLEVGPGCGTLTVALADQARRVVAVEVARRLKPVLEETLHGRNNVEVIFGDFLHVPAEQFAAPSPWLMVSNLPYSITTPALFRFLDGEIAWSRLVITIQAEVAERMAARPGSGEYGGLSIAAQAAATVSVVKRLSSSSFWPRPRVASAVVRLEPRLEGRPSTLRSLLRDAFSARRKTLRNALAAHPLALSVLRDRGVDPGRRAETVAVEDWVAAAHAELAVAPAPSSGEQDAAGPVEPRNSGDRTP